MSQPEPDPSPRLVALRRAEALASRATRSSAARCVGASVWISYCSLYTSTNWSTREDCCGGDGLRWPGRRRVPRRNGQRRHLRRRRPGEDRRPQAERPPDLRAGPRRPRRAEPAAGPAPIHHRRRARRSRTPTSCSSPSARRPTRTARPTCATCSTSPKSIGEHMTREMVVVTKSTVPVGHGGQGRRRGRPARDATRFTCAATRSS